MANSRSMLAGKSSEFTVSTLTSLSQISRSEWDICANPSGSVFNPFLSYDFLYSLEESGCAVSATGWNSCHFVLRDGTNTALAVMPCYLKTHSYGEYVFDQAFAEAYARVGGRYYPKLQTAVPFTPVTGPRLLIRSNFPKEQAQALLVKAALETTSRCNASSWHLTFATETEWRDLGSMGLLQRIDTQYHWFNQDYSNFDDFLSTLASRKRKTIRKEREQALSPGLQIEWLTGSSIHDAHWDAFFEFYMDTGSRKWGMPYLNRQFFDLLGAKMADRILLVMAKRDGSYVAGALNLIGGDTLFGRYWGCLEAHNFLHFEICYYQAIEYAIANKIRVVEAGAQGDHKLARGYIPKPTYSLHHFVDPGLSAGVAHYLEQERRAIADQQEMLDEFTPYKKCN